MGVPGSRAIVGVTGWGVGVGVLASRHTHGRFRVGCSELSFQGRMLRAESEHLILHPSAGSEARRWAGAGQVNLLEGSADVGRHLKSEAEEREGRNNVGGLKVVRVQFSLHVAFKSHARCRLLLHIWGAASANVCQASWRKRVAEDSVDRDCECPVPMFSPVPLHPYESDSD